MPRGSVARGEATPYALNPETEVAYLFANGVRLARLAYELQLGDVPSVNGEQLHVFFELGDHLGSTSVVLDKATGELVERSTYQAYGGSESDYRPERWKHFREDYRFTGKEEDVEVGLIYFGKRFLNPLLNRWVSADPLQLVAWDQADPNLYAYVGGRALLDTDPLGLQATPAPSPKIAPQPKGTPPKIKTPGAPRPNMKVPEPKKIEFPSTGTGRRIWLPPAWWGPPVAFVYIMIQPEYTATNDQEETNAKGLPKKYYAKRKGKGMPRWENKNLVKIEHYSDGTWVLSFRIKSKRTGWEREFSVRYDSDGRLDSGNTAHIKHDGGVQYVPIGKSRDADADAANAARKKPQEDGTVWHHAGIVEINGAKMYRMELWDADVHETATHAGAYSDAKADRGESKASRQRKPEGKK